MPDYVAISQEDVVLVSGALETLASLLMAYDHEWTDGEKAIYEEALRAIGQWNDDKAQPGMEMA